MSGTLPPPRAAGAYAIGLVCLGNICRSPTADVVLTTRVAAAGLAEHVTVASCGTGDWHVGRRMDLRAAATLTAAGYDASAHRAQQLDDSWFTRFDLLLAMDRANLADVTRQCPVAGAGRVQLFGDFDPLAPGGEVPDPYYGGDSGFEEVLAMVERTTGSILAALLRDLPDLRGGPRDDSGPR